jgi:hypothetical protein
MAPPVSFQAKPAFAHFFDSAYSTAGQQRGQNAIPSTKSGWREAQLKTAPYASSICNRYHHNIILQACENLRENLFSGIIFALPAPLSISLNL